MSPANMRLVGSAAVSETLERDQEMACISSALDDAAAGTGRVVLVTGPPGIGKTRLIDETRALAKERGFGRLLAAGYDTERTIAWGVVRQLVERSTLRYSGEIRERILAGPAGRALTAIDAAPADIEAGESTLAPTLHALWWVASDLSAERPLLITVDDVHWADLPSLRFLAHLAERIGDLSVALVVATGPADAASVPPLRSLLDTAHARVEPQPLSRDGLAGVVAERGAVAAAAVLDALLGATGGNPLHVRQLLDALEASGSRLGDPRTAEAIAGLAPAIVVRGLLARLSPSALAVAKALAVTGPEEGALLAEDLTGLGGSDVKRALGELRTAHVIASEDPPVYEHPVVREAVAAAMGRGERAALHASAARLLSGRGAPPDRVAAHIVAAPLGSVPEAASRLRDSARNLVAAGDAPAAAAHLRRAVEESPGDVELLAELGDALLRAGQAAEAHDRLLEAASATPEPVLRARRFAAAAAAMLAVGGPPAAARELDDLLDGGEGSGDDEARLVLDGQLGAVASFDPAELRRCAGRLAHYSDLPGRTRSERAVLALLARIAWGQVRPATEVAALARRALGDGEWVRGGPGSIAAFGGAFHALTMADDLEAGRENLRRASDGAAELSPRAFVVMSTSRSVLSLRAGDIAATARDSSAAMEASVLAERDAAIEAMYAIAARTLALASIELDDPEAAGEVLEHYEWASRGGPETIPHQRVRLARAVLALAVGEPAAALEEAETLGTLEAAAGVDNPSVPWRSVAALAALRLGKSAAARAHAAEQLGLARAWGAPTDLGAALRLAARVEPDDRRTRLEEAVAVLETAPGRLELGYALADLGEVLRVERRRAEAREYLRRASQVATECGSRLLEMQAAQALEALGDRPRDVSAAGIATLTGSEQRVAELAAAGHTNREIAQVLFITPKTVENHLGRIYLKLGVSGRRELAGALGR